MDEVKYTVAYLESTFEKPFAVNFAIVKGKKNALKIYCRSLYNYNIGPGTSYSI